MAERWRQLRRPRTATFGTRRMRELRPLAPHSFVLEPAAMNHPLTRWALLAALIINTSCNAELASEPLETEPYDPEPAAVAAQLAGTSYASLAAEEFPGFGLAQIEAQLPLLKQYGVSLVLHWPSTKLAANDARWAFVAKAQAMGVVVKPWLLLPEGTTAQTGYFASSTNAAEFVKRSQQ